MVPLQFTYYVEVREATQDQGKDINSTQAPVIKLQCNHCATMPLSVLNTHSKKSL